MNFSMRGHDFEASSAREVSEKCKEYGLYGVQFVMPQTIKDFKVGQFSPSYAARIKDEFDKNNIKIPLQGCYINPSCTDPKSLKEQMDRFKEQLRYVKYTGAFMLGTETGYIGDTLDPEKNDTEEAYQYLLRNLKELVEYAEKLGVMVGIEGVWMFVINSPKKMRRLLDDLNSPNVLVIFDPVNLLNASNCKDQDKMIDEMFELLGNEISVLHLKDFIIDDEGVLRSTLPTEGHLNIKKILTFVKHRKPDLPVVLEGVKEKDLRKVMENVTKVYESIE